MYRWQGLGNIGVALERIKVTDLKEGQLENRREKSLGLLTQKFIKMFLQQENNR